VHANRVRPFYEKAEHQNLTTSRETCLFEDKTKHRQLVVKVLVGDICEYFCDVIVNPTDSQFLHANDVAATIWRAAGELMNQQCQLFLQTQGALAE
jgi:hypothetical protein